MLAGINQGLPFLWIEEHVRFFKSLLSLVLSLVLSLSLSLMLSLVLSIPKGGSISYRETAHLYFEALSTRDTRIIICSGFYIGVLSS